LRPREIAGRHQCPGLDGASTLQERYGEHKDTKTGGSRGRRKRTQ